MDQTPDITQLMKLANSPAGRQLIQLLQRRGGQELEKAAKTASSGDYSQAKELLSSLLNTPEAKKLLQQLEDSK